MDRKKEDVVKEMQLVVEQMKKDDIDDNPDSEKEFFQCDACGEETCLAGSIQYGDYRLCNDCVLLAEVGFELGQIKDIQELIDAMEDKRLESDCNYINREDSRYTN